MSFLQIPIGTNPNTFLGYEALRSVVITPGSGILNTAFGFNALKSLVSGSRNTAIGNIALRDNQTGDDNTAVGNQVMRIANNAFGNVGVGHQAFYSLTTGSFNVGIGWLSLFGLTTGGNNTAIGQGSGRAITTGSDNSILGGYSGNQGGLDIRTLSNYIVLSDGAGNPRLWIDNTGAANIPGGLALTGSLSITGGTVTANNPVLSATQTWNNAAVTFTGWQLNVTDTASAAASLLMDLQRGGVSQFRVRKDGQLAFNGDLVINPSDINLRATAANGVLINSTGVSIGELSAIFFRDAPASAIYSALRATVSGVIEQRNGVNAQTLRVYNTFTDASNYERGRFAWVSNVLTIGTENAGTGLARAIDFQTAGTSRIVVDTSGRVSVGTSSAFDRLTVQNFSGVSGGIFVLGTTSDANWGGGISFANYLGTAYGSINAATTGLNITSAASSTGVYIRTAGSGDTSIFFDNSKNTILNSAAIATNATNGFLYVAGCAGIPTGTPTAYTGRVPIVVDTTNNKLYFYSGGAWRDAGP